MQFERRSALVPGSKLPSPEEAQLILRQRNSSERLASRCVDTGQNQPLSPSLQSSHKNNLVLKIPQQRAHQQLERYANLTEKAQLRSNTIQPETSHYPPQDPRSRSTLYPPSRGRQLLPNRKAPGHVLLDHKRKHTYYSQDEQRQYPPTLSEDIVHMSEIASDDGLKAADRDIFGGRSTSSVFDESGRAWELHTPRSTDTCRSVSSVSAVSPRDMSLAGRSPFWGR